VHESPTEPITGLGFKEPTEEVPNSYLFIVTTNRVLSYQASGRNSGGVPVVIDEIGAGLGCAMMDWTARNIIVARDEAIYSCGVEGRGACYAYEGDFLVIDFVYSESYLGSRSQILYPYTLQLPCDSIATFLPNSNVGICDCPKSGCPNAERY
jgi:hypothetical protein